MGYLYTSLAKMKNQILTISTFSSGYLHKATFDDNYEVWLGEVSKIEGNAPKFSSGRERRAQD